MKTLQQKILTEISAERVRQDEKFGADRSQDPRVWLPILIEEVGEVGTAILNWNFNKDVTLENYREELLQVAAVCVAMIEDLDKNPIK